MKYVDYYSALGISRHASQDEIQQRYRDLARQYHPDVNKDPAATEKFKEINEAYEVLKDSDKRDKYDKYGAAWKVAQERGQGGMPPGFENLGFGDAGFGSEGVGSFFEMLFGRRPRGGDRGGFRMGGQDHDVKVVLGLDEAAHGGTREVVVNAPESGEVTKVDVKIPPGVAPGQRIRLAGKGGTGLGGGPPGDLYLVVEVAPHPHFKLKGKDLHATLSVAPWEAALGVEVTQPTLEGLVTLKVPAGSSSGRKIRLKGKGFPSRKDGPGDLYVEIRVAVPSEPSDEERRLYEELARVSAFSPR